MGTADIIDVQVLNYVDAGLSMREMGAKLNLAPSNVNKRVFRMVKEGLIQDPQRSPTGRAISRGYRLTQKGRDYLKTNGYTRA
jgi:DNA-binding MarR family transcriptional regulator